MEICPVHNSTVAINVTYDNAQLSHDFSAAVCSAVKRVGGQKRHPELMGPGLKYEGMAC